MILPETFVKNNPKSIVFVSESFGTFDCVNFPEGSLILLKNFYILTVEYENDMIKTPTLIHRYCLKLKSEYPFNQLVNQMI